MFSKLNFYVVNVTPIVFLRRFCKAACSDQIECDLAQFLIECSYYDFKILDYKPSEVAIGALYLTRAMTKRIPIWNETIGIFR